MNKHLRPNQITQNQEGTDLLPGVWVIRERDGWVFKDRTLGQFIFLGCLYHFFPQCAMFIHISENLYLNVAILENGKFFSEEEIHISMEII